MGAILDNLALGFGVALAPANLLFALAGVLVGTLIGVLPGLGPLATIAMLLPLTFYLPPDAALIMLAGIYYGAQYGGSTTAILANMPGEASSVVTCLDGHAMARRGRGGAALAIAALASFTAGSIATIVIAIASPPLTSLALKFGAPEYFSLMVCGLMGAIILAQGSVISAIGMVFFGLLLGMVGSDVETGSARYMFGVRELSDGIGVTPLAMGLFGIAEILRNLEQPIGRTINAVVGSLMPNRAEIRAAAPAALRGTLVGSVLGVLPGGGALLSSFASYALEKKLSKDPSRFGHGAVEGVAGPEAANNSGAQTSFIPMLTLGIPSNAVMALMVGAMILQGVTPGPQVLTERPALFWGLIASMWVGNLMLVIINLPLVGIWVSLLRVPYRILFPIILAICSIGAYVIANSVIDIWFMLGFGVLGYILGKIGCEPAPLLLGFILGPLMEENFRRAMALSRGDPMVFLDRPISAGFLLATLVLLSVVFWPNMRRKRAEVFQE